MGAGDENMSRYHGRHSRSCSVGMMPPDIHNRNLFPALGDRMQRIRPRADSKFPLRKGHQHDFGSKSFPYDEIDQNRVKLKSIPVEFRWRNHGGENTDEEQGSENPIQYDKSRKHVLPWVTPPRWFNRRPRVILVQGILGREPGSPRGVNPDQMHEVDHNDPVGGQSGHIRVEEAASPSPNHIPANPRPLSRFLGHFWGKKSKSYARAVRAESAPVFVVMRGSNQRGGGGFGARRHGRGAGRTCARVWVRQMEQKPREEGEFVANPQKEGGQDTDAENNQAPQWEQAPQGQAPQPQQWGANQGAQGTQGANRRDEVNWNTIPPRASCAFCGFKNHATKDCRFKSPCENCGVDDHLVYDCKQYPVWNLGPELCASQVEDQSFFYIEEDIDPRMVRDRSNFAVITVVSGNVTSKAIHDEFVNALGKDKWKWSARQVSEGKYVMRFPSAQMIKDWGYFSPLGMRTINAQIMIDPWTPAIESKGTLQRGWFRIRGIPLDQRSVKTVAKVGGLVGKVVEIDEKTRKRNEYVRARIACRDVTKVPRTAEGTLGLHIFDFHFEREVLVENEKVDRNKTAVGDTSTQQQHKKARMEDIGHKDQGAGRASINDNMKGTNDGKADNTGKKAILLLSRHNSQEMGIS